jgi:hypothetical protein|tara:strand:+ start:154 stop:456 length:303 start_codon:yes stop_codon:yes gene_type:complete
MKYENHAIGTESVIMVAEDDVFTVYSQNDIDLNNWLQYFRTSEEWEKEYLKTDTPFISLTRNPYVESVREDVDRDRYNEMLEMARGMGHHEVLGDGEEDV